MSTISIDVFGGDNAPYEIIKGAIEAISDKKNLNVILVGREKEILGILKEFDYDSERLTIQNANEVIGMGEKPTVALRKKNSSMFVGIKLVKDNIAQAFVTAGNSGAAMTIAIFVLGKLKNVNRPAIATFLPTLNGDFLMLDVGANVDCRATHLAEFSIMGGVYIKHMRGIEKPRIGLLSNGSEPGKGNRIVVEAYGILSKSKINFIGNVEGDDIYDGKADVVVCDGFIGNIVLKSSESIPEIIVELLRSEIKRSLWYKLGFLLAKPAFRLLRNKLNYAEFGGAPLLGVNGFCIIGHGRSKALAIKNAIFQAVSFSTLKINDKIELALSNWKKIYSVEILEGL